MPRAEVSIFLSHRKRCMPQHPLKGQYVTTIHHIVASKSMTQDMDQLPLRQIKLLGESDCNLAYSLSFDSANIR